MYVHKMELKVWVEGIQRVICGVTEATTCQDVVIALAHATGKTGRFTLVERWRDSERLLAPTEPPLRVLHKWGEYASDVQFILRHSDKDRRKDRGGGGGSVGGSGAGGDHGSKRTERFLHNFTPHGGGLLGGTQGHLPQRRSSGSSIRKSLTFSGAHSFFPPVKSSSPATTNKSTTGSAVTNNNNKSAATTNSTTTTPGPNSSLESLDDHFSSASFSSKSSNSPYASMDKQRLQYAALGGSLERKGHRLSPRRSPRPSSPPQHAKTSPRLQQQQQHQHNQHPHHKQHQPHQHHQQKQAQRVPTVNHHKLPDNKPNNVQQTTNNNNIAKIVGTSHIETPMEEYDLDRELKSPTSRTSPAVVVTHERQGSHSDRSVDFAKVNGTLSDGEVVDKGVRHSPTPTKDDLMKLVRLQQERLTVQDSQIKILDSEIQYWEGREQDFDKQYAAVKEETTRLQHTEKTLDDSLQELDLVSWVDKLEIEKQQEKMLQSELTLVRSQVANAESGLLSSKSKEHSLRGELEDTRREQLSREHEHQERELKVLHEISELQKLVNRKMLLHEQNQGSLEQLAAEVKSLESAILEKKTQIAECEKELRTVNMDVFIKAPSTDWLQPPAMLDVGKAEKSHGRLSPSRPGSSRRMIHNPQLLKETVATTKNPHGMWV